MAPTREGPRRPSQGVGLGGRGSQGGGRRRHAVLEASGKRDSYDQKVVTPLCIYSIVLVTFERDSTIPKHRRNQVYSSPT